MTRNNRETRPLYWQVADQITQGVASGKWHPGDKLPSERAMCQEFGVSQITVRRALRELAHMGQVYSRHGLGWFVEEVAAQGSRPEVAIVLGGYDNLTRSLLEECTQTLDGLAIGSELLFCGEGEAATQRVRSFLDALAPQVVLWVVAGKEQELLQRYQALTRDWDIPGILLARQVRGIELAAITLDEQQAISQMTEHLLALGHQRIAYVGTDPTQTEGWRRYWGFANMLWDRGLELPLEWVLAVKEDETPEQGRLADIFKDAQQPTAIVCSSDTLAAQVMQQLEGIGLACPRDVAIVGAGDQALSAYLPVPLTTYRFDLQTLAETVATTTRALLAGDSPSSQRITGQLVVRASCGANPEYERP